MKEKKEIYKYLINGGKPFFVSSVLKSSKLEGGLLVSTTRGDYFLDLKNSEHTVFKYYWCKIGEPVSDIDLVVYLMSEIKVYQGNLFSELNLIQDIENVIGEKYGKE